MLIHDPAAAEDRSRFRAVGGAAALALENERLEADLRASVQELRASRARIVESGDIARRRIERDLHDGAQQQLVALAIALRTARSRLDRDPQAAGELIEAASEDLDAAIRELRELARGIHPAVLSDRGLEAALDALAGRIPLPVEVQVTLDDRLPEPVEAAATSSSRRRSRTSPATPAPRTPRSRSRATARRCGPRCATTASAAPIRPPARACAGSPTASRCSTAGSRSSRRRAPERPSGPSSRARRSHQCTPRMRCASAVASPEARSSDSLSPFAADDSGNTL